MWIVARKKLNPSVILGGVHKPRGRKKWAKYGHNKYQKRENKGTKNGTQKGQKLDKKGQIGTNKGKNAKRGTKIRQRMGKMDQNKK